MKASKIARGVVLVLAGALSAIVVSGCSGTQPTVGQTGPTSESGPSPRAAPAPETSAKSGDVARCRTADLSAALGAKQKEATDIQGELGAAGTKYAIALVWTNSSAHTCTMSGFGGVDIVGPSTKNTPGGVYSLPRAGEQPGTVTLAPGASAHTRVSYIADDSGNPHPNPFWTPDHLLVTPPDESNHITVRWAGAGPVYWGVEDSAAAGSISPVTPGKS